MLYVLISGFGLEDDDDDDDDPDAKTDPNNQINTQVGFLNI